VLAHDNTGDRNDIHADFIGQGGRLPARFRAFIDFLTERRREAGPFERCSI
jgi:hypothetical protein